MMFQTRNEPDIEPLLLRPAEAARLLSVSPRTLWRLSMETGAIPVVKVGRSVRYSRDDLLAFVERTKSIAERLIA